MIASNYENTLDQYQNLAVALVIDDKIQDYMKSSESEGEIYTQEANIIYDFLLNLMDM